MKILLVDDHPLFREGLAGLLAQQFPDASVLEAGDAAGALQLAQDHPDLALVLLDLNMRGVDGRAALPALRLCAPRAPIVILSASEAPEDMKITLRAGARGYVAKSASPTEFRSALRLVLDGGIYVPSAASVREAPREDAVDTTMPGNEVPALTPRERSVLVLLCEGTPNKRIAEVLGISEGTVHTHLKSIFRSLGVNNRTQAAVEARRLGVDTSD